MITRQSERSRGVRLLAMRVSAGKPLVGYRPGMMAARALKARFDRAWVPGGSFSVRTAK